jgi:hypothetical protein
VTGLRRVLAAVATPASEAHHGVSKSVSQTDGCRPVQPFIGHPPPYTTGADASGKTILASLACNLGLMLYGQSIARVHHKEHPGFFWAHAVLLLPAVCTAR